MPLLQHQHDIPFIDPNVEHVGVSRLRKLDSAKLKETVEKNTLVIQESDTSVAVLLSYERFLIIQDQLQSVMATLEVLSSKDEVRELLLGLKEAKEGKTNSLDSIRKSLDHTPA